MNLEEFEDYCNNNLWKRKTDISSLKQILNNTKNSTRQTKVLSKTFIIIIYSNWEWYIDEISREYLNHINYLYSEYTKWIFKLDIEFKNGNASIKNIKSEYFKRLNLSYESFTSLCWERILFNLKDISKIWFKSGNNFMDNFELILDKMVKTRNSIAHWKELDNFYSVEELNILSDFIIKTLDMYKEFLFSNLENKTYLK